jgi:hypothetical protein
MMTPSLVHDLHGISHDVVKVTTAVDLIGNFWEGTYYAVPEVIGKKLNRIPPFSGKDIPVVEDTPPKQVKEGARSPIAKIHRRF